MSDWHPTTRGVEVLSERNEARRSTVLVLRLPHIAQREITDTAIEDSIDAPAMMRHELERGRVMLLRAVLSDIIEHDPSLLVDRPETLFDTCDEAVQWCERLGTRLIELAAEMERRR